MKNKKQKIIFFYVKAGGGHLAGSKTIAESIQNQYPDVKIELFDILQNSHKIVQKLFNKGYSYIVNYIPLIFSAASIIMRPKRVNKAILDALALETKKDIIKIITKHKPDKIVTTYFCSRIIRKALKDMDIDIPLITVVTDNFTPPNAWFSETKSEYITLSQRAKQVGVDQGIDQNKIKVFEGLINQRYNKSMTQKEKNIFKKEKDLDNNLTILLTGGGPGLNNMEKMVKRLTTINKDVNILCVTGYNKIQRKRMEIIAKRSERIKVFGFVDFMYELINISDLVISKAGPASVLEILMINKPLIITSYIWEQEKGNMEFVVNNNMGYYEPNPIRAVGLVNKILNDKELQKQLVKNINKNKIKNEVDDLAKYIYNL